jgi:hypothetical protein
VRRGDAISYPWADGRYPWLCQFGQPPAVEPSLSWQMDPAYYGYKGCSCAEVRACSATVHFHGSASHWCDDLCRQMNRVLYGDKGCDDLCRQMNRVLYGDKGCCCADLQCDTCRPAGICLLITTSSTTDQNCYRAAVALQPLCISFCRMHNILQPLCMSFCRVHDDLQPLCMSLYRVFDICKHLQWRCSCAAVDPHVGCRVHASN